MGRNKIIAWALILVALVVLAGIIFEYGEWWLLVDILVILVCGISGLLLWQR